MHATRREILDIIKENNYFVVGEFNVIPRDALIRFVITQPSDLSSDDYSIISTILDDILGLFPKVQKQENLELRIPSAHRYTKFNYVVDKFSLYIPYHYHISELYGIYLREPVIKEDIKNFMKYAISFLNDERFYERLRIPTIDKRNVQALLKHRAIAFSIILSLYFEAIYYHALAHHVIEDLSTIYELWGLEKYSILNQQDEEGFSEYVMYKALKGELGWNEPSGGFALKLLYNLRELSVIPPFSSDDLMRFLKFFRSVFASILYIYRNITLYKEYPFYKPKVTENVAEKLSLLFVGYWYQHTSDIELIKIKLGGKEIFQRVNIIEA